MDVVSEKPVGLGQALELLEKRKKDGELGYEQQNTFDYLTHFASLSAKEEKELKKELEELGFLNEKHVAMLLALVPKKEDDVKAVLVFDKSVFSGEQVKEVLKVVKKFAGK
ncbi:MAG: DNA-directed RNA polymerase subunit F [Candidatus Micrarchaeota archaeon]